MINHYKYFKYVMRHKWYVLIAGWYLGVPLWLLLTHDRSKFSRAEWKPYVDNFFTYPIKDERPLAVREHFARAVNHHYFNNPHHWQYWLNPPVTGITCVQMPERYAKEMVADWAAAGRAITGKWDLQEWYVANRAYIKVHPETRALVDQLVETIIINLC